MDDKHDHNYDSGRDLASPLLKSEVSACFFFTINNIYNEIEIIFQTIATDDLLKDTGFVFMNISQRSFNSIFHQ